MCEGSREGRSEASPGAGSVTAASGPRQIRARVRCRVAVPLHRRYTSRHTLRTSQPPRITPESPEIMTQPRAVVPPHPRRPLRGWVGLVGWALLLAAVVPAPAGASEPDYAGWRTLLQQYVRAVQAKGEPWNSRFDYEQLYIDENIWTLHRADGLNTLHTQLLSVSPADMTPRERTAWAINAYNLLVIERMTLHLLVPGRKYVRYDSPKQVNNEDGTFFAAPVARIDGQSYTLTGFERRFVYGDTSADPMSDGTVARERAGDPRLMCALIKASRCSGPLQRWPYRADSLDAQLNRAARMALALPTWLRVEPGTGTLAATNRFFDERADFGGPELTGLMPFVLRFGPMAAKRLIQVNKLSKPSIFFEPDWKLNQFDHPKPKLPGAVGADSAQAGRKS